MPLLFLLALIAQQTAPMVVPGHGQIAPTPSGAANRPDPALRYRVVVSITRAASGVKDRNPGLEKVARLLNLLGESGIRPAHGDIVPIVHAAATPLVLRPAAYARRHGGAANPDADLLARLKALGMPAHVCAQALAASGFAVDDVSPDVIVDVSALTTIATLQLRGYALIAE